MAAWGLWPFALCLAVVSALALILEFIVDGLISLRLERRHSATIAEMDAMPGPTSRRLTFFVRRRGDRDLGDARLTRLVRWSRAAGVVAPTCGLGAVILILLGR